MKTTKGSLLLIIIFLTGTIVSGCSQASGSEKSFFDKIFVEPFVNLIHDIAVIFNGNFGLSIIIITVLIRLVLMPLLLKQYKNQQLIKGKMDAMKPEMDEVQHKLKTSKDPTEQQKLQQELLGLYQKHGVNPLASIGCLPLFIQMPILMGLYYAITTSEEIASHSFLWFNLGAPDILITALAGIVYYLQFKVSQSQLPEQQKSQMKYLGYLSPVMIVLFSLNAPSALPLYWAVGGIFLILQSVLAKRLYGQATIKSVTESY